MLHTGCSALVIILLEYFILMLEVIILISQFCDLCLILPLIIASLLVNHVLVSFFQRLSLSVMQT